MSIVISVENVKNASGCINLVPTIHKGFHNEAYLVSCWTHCKHHGLCGSNKLLYKRCVV